MPIQVVSRAVPVNLKAPVAAVARLRRGPFAFLLESARGPERWARYTFIGTEPKEVWRYARGRAERWTAAAGWTDEGPCPAPLRHIGDLVRRHEVENADGLPRFFGGAVGFIGYDVVRGLEKIGPGPAADVDLPDALVMIADTVLVLDKELGTGTLLASAEIPDTARREERDGLVAEANARLDRWQERLAQPVELERWRDPELDPPALHPTSPFAEAAFLAGVGRIKEHIAAGDVFQAVLSRRLEVRGTFDPLVIYGNLRSSNPSPYLYYLQLGDTAIAGSSPEVLVRVEEREVTLRPIAGTRPRGTPAEQDVLDRELLNDPKERAEHQMLVDLGRNDLGRIAEYGSVRLVESMVIERYAHVRHIVSELRARLREGLDAVDALEACFPAGTVTGAPKVRAMQLIDALEPSRRGVYAGAIGYLGWGARQLDTAIAIRTCVVLPDRVLVQAGAGIVADSDPGRELAETGQKSRSALDAIAFAHPLGLG